MTVATVAAKDVDPGVPQGYPRFCHTPLPCSTMGAWPPARCWASISRPPGSTASTMSPCPTRWCTWWTASWSRAGRASSTRAARSRRGDRGPRDLDGTGTRRGHAVAGGDQPGGRRGGVCDRARRATGGHEARLRPHHPRRAGRALGGRASSSGAGAGRCSTPSSSTAISIPTARAGGRWPTCAISTASTSGTPTMRRRTDRLYRGALRSGGAPRGAAGVRSRPTPSGPGLLAPPMDPDLRRRGGCPRA